MKDQNNEKLDFFITQEGKQVKLDIPVEGMLGLLAYGDIGLKAWRKKRTEELEKIKKVKK
ncbi:MAG: hypothetical protein HXX09_03955 [Bacteroidetes bacterium]|nr:hypothetical protein [Bacteroidota bacterium]